MSSRRIRWAVVGLVVVCGPVFGLVPAGGAQPSPPLSYQRWLGDWKTNFGELWFYSLSYEKVGFNDDGTDFSPCQRYRTPDECQKTWVLRGIWHWPGAKGHVNPTTGKVDGPPFGAQWVVIKAAIDPKQPNSLEPCWVGPRAVFYGPGYAGDECNFMLLYRHGDQEQGGGWKTCPLEGSGPNCADHHYLHGQKVAQHTGQGGLWKVGFRFTQKGKPDGHQVISTQTGGAGSIMFPENPNKEHVGFAADGSLVFHIDDLGAAPEPQFTITLQKGVYNFDGQRGQTTLFMSGEVTTSNTAQCGLGADVTITLVRRHNRSHPDALKLLGSGNDTSCPTRETWTSTDKNRVNVKIEQPRRIG